MDRKVEIAVCQSGRLRAEEPHGPIDSIDEVFVEWSDREPVVATIHIKGVRRAKLVPGAKPGW